MISRAKERIIRVLRWSEKYTKTDMLYLARGGSLSILSQVIGLVASLSLAVVVGHIVPKEVYGIYKYVLSIVAVLSAFSLSGIGNAVTQSTARGYDGALQKGFNLNLRWSIVLFVGAFILAMYYLVAGNTTLAMGVFIGGSLSPFLASANLYISFLAGKKDFVRQITYATIENVIPVALFILVIIFTKNPVILVATYFAANLGATLYFYQRTKKRYQPDASRTDMEMLSYSKHLSAMNILGGIADNLDQILLFHYVGATQLAIYNFATAVPDQIKAPIKTVNAMIFARFSGGDPDAIRNSMRNKFLWFFLFTGAVTLVYIAVAPFLFRTLFPAYVVAVPYSQIYALWMISAFLDPASVYLLAYKKIREQYIVNIVLSFFKIVSLFVGVLLWGLLGVIVASLATKWLFAFLSFGLYELTIRRDTARTD